MALAISQSTLGNGSYEFGIETLGGHKVQGGVYVVTQWGAGLWGAANEGPTAILSGDLLGSPM